MDQIEELKQLLTESYDWMMDVELKYNFRNSTLRTRIRAALGMDEHKTCPKCAANAHRTSGTGIANHG